MNEVKTKDNETWELLKTDFVVTKTTQAFCNNFVDQGLEQEIKNFKRFVALPGLTQDEDALNRFITIAPHLVRFVEKFLQTFPKCDQNAEEESGAYHQLQGNMGLRCAKNSVRLQDCIVTYCQGNRFALDTPLRNITSGAIIPENATHDILNYPELGQA